VTDEVRSTPVEDNTVSGWLCKIGDWRAWAHTLYAGAVGAIGSGVLLWFAVAGAFGGVGVAVGLGIAALLIFALLFALGAFFHPRGSRMPSAVWLGVSVILWMGCLAGTFVVSSQAAVNAQHPSEWIGPAIGGITAAAAALVTWPGPGRVIAVAGVVAALAFIEPWPVTPTYSGEDQSGQIKVVPYMAQLPEYPYYGDPEPAYGAALLWHFRDGSAAAEDPVSFTVITEDGAPEACRGDLYALTPLPTSDGELTCEAVSIEGLDGAMLRTGTVAHELTTVIDGTRVRVVADASVPESLLADALRSAVPMPQQMYEAWIATRN
jgi:hypothetical protein